MIRQKVDKIMSYKTYTDEDKINSLLEINANIYTNIGKDSTKTETQQAESDSKYIYRSIQKLDDRLGRLLLRDART